MIKRVRLDTILKQHGWIDDEQIQMGLAQQERTGCRWGSALVDLGVINETQLAQALCEQHKTPLWDPATFTPEPKAMALFNEEWQRQNGVLPLEYDPETDHLHIAMSNPQNNELVSKIRDQLDLVLLTVSAAPQGSLDRIWDQFFRFSNHETRREDNATESKDTIIVVTETNKNETSTDAKTSDATEQTSAGREAQSASDRVSLARKPTSSESHPQTRVLIWITRSNISAQVAALLESENCVTEVWDGVTTPKGRWDYLIYDTDTAESRPQALEQLRKDMPDLHMVRRSSFSSAMLQSPIPYEQMRDGYLWLAEHCSSWLGEGTDASDIARYASTVPALCGVSPEDSDTIAVACFLELILQKACPSSSEREKLLATLECPYPVTAILKRQISSSGHRKFSGDDPAPVLEASVFDVLMAFFKERKKKPIQTIAGAGQFHKWLRNNPDQQYDPLASDSLLRVLREEILERYLPPGPAEVVLVGNEQSVWGKLPEILEKEGWHVVVSQDASEARVLVRRRRPDAVVWATSEAWEWIRWQSRCAPEISSFLIVDTSDSNFARAAILAGFEDVWTTDWDPVVAAAKLRRIVERKPLPSSDSETMNGTLSQLSLIDLIQIMETGRRRVKIDFSHGNSKGRLVLWDGQVKFAEAGELAGEAAVYEILRWTEGTFTCTPVESNPEPNCDVTNEALLLEGSRRLDENRKVEVVSSRTFG